MAQAREEAERIHGPLEKRLKRVGDQRTLPLHETSA